MRIPYFCSYIPLELIKSLGHETVDISLFEVEKCDSSCNCSLHDNICSYVKYLYGKILADEGRFDFAVIPNSCDAMKKLHTSLEYSGKIRSFLLDIPRRTSPESARYLASQYRTLIGKLMPARDEAAVLNLMQTRAVSGSASSAPTARGTADPHPVRIGIAGSTFSPPQFEAILEKYGAGGVFIRHCGQGLVASPSRLSPEFNSLEDKLFSLAWDSLQNTICPRVDRGRMADHVVAETKGQRLAGLIFSTLKFCDFYAFEFEKIRKRLPPDFPSLYIENDLSVRNDEQNVTRIEAFMEKILSGFPRSEKSDPLDSAGPAGRISIGLDVGSTTTKGVVMKNGGEILASVILPTSLIMKDSADEAMSGLMQKCGLSGRDIARVVLTGYGRAAFPGRDQITEITCHALGVHFLWNAGATIIDIGGQDSKAIRIDAEGHVLHFAMNDKCAAGTGRFLESMVRRMNISFDDFSAMSLAAKEATQISSMCSVFAESEVVSIMAKGTPAGNIARGLNAAVADRVRGLVRKIQGEPPFILTGGLSLNAGFVSELETALVSKITIFRESQLAGAIGAAIAASGQGELHGKGARHVTDG
jgi:predicted CoA-substrate-specific enzyme activase